MSDAKLAEMFLVPKKHHTITYSIICNAGANLKTLENEDGSVKYPYYAALTAVDSAYVHTRILEKYIAISRDPKKYDVNLEAVVAVYNKLLEDNWQEFDAEVRKADKETREQGKKTRNYSFYLNSVLIEQTLSILNSIDLKNVKGLEL